MFAAANDRMKIPARCNVQRNILLLKNEIEVHVYSLIHASASPVYCNYMVVAANWAGQHQNMHSAIINFERFHTAHTAERVRMFLLGTLRMCKLCHRLPCVLKDNESGMVRGMEDLPLVLLRMDTKNYTGISTFHLGCVSQVLNLAVKDFMPFIHERIEKLRRILTIIRSSVKRRDVFAVVEKALGVSSELLSLDYDMERSSTFQMMQKSFRI